MGIVPKVEAKSRRLIPFQLNQKGPVRQVSPNRLNQEVEQNIINETNGVRSQKGLSILKFNALIQKVATLHSQDMMSRNYLSHFSPEGKSLLDRVQKLKKPIQTHLGENIHTIKSSHGLYDSQAIADLMVKDWMKSPSHRKNILSKNFTQIGVGCVSNGKKVYCTQVFSGSNL